MPEVFCLDDNPDETIAFLAEMQKAVLREGVRLSRLPKRALSVPIVDEYFDFSTIRQVGVSAALVLAALYDRQRAITHLKMGTVNEDLWDPEVKRVLLAVGFHEILGVISPRPRQQGNDARVLRFTSGSSADGAAAGRLQSALAELLPDDVERQALLYAEPYGGILEAILNSHSWAYPPNTTWEFPQLARWWITGAVDTVANVVEVIAYDQGVSIPVSLPRWRHWSELEVRLNRLARRLGFAGAADDPRNDGAAIALATKIARSSTNLPQHGKGLHTMFEVAERARHGRLRILSRFGEYVWERGVPAVIRSRDHALTGTLVHWTLEL